MSLDTRQSRFSELFSTLSSLIDLVHGEQFLNLGVITQLTWCSLSLDSSILHQNDFVTKVDEINSMSHQDSRLVGKEL